MKMDELVSYITVCKNITNVNHVFMILDMCTVDITLVDQYFNSKVREHKITSLFPDPLGEYIGITASDPYNQPNLGRYTMPDFSLEKPP